MPLPSMGISEMKGVALTPGQVHLPMIGPWA